MWIADKYIDYVKDQTVKHPGESWNKMLLGFQANKYRMKLLPKKGISKGYQKLEAMMLRMRSAIRRAMYGEIFFRPARSSDVSD